ncbi:MAG: Arc family DNA-binding protein [Hylemonella sp.]|uniref:Arc family DNA-binding protein n=1 Tax=Hylemonella sp. TaxID=2066020 RepID=UPI003918B9B4
MVTTKAKSQATATGRAPKFLLAMPSELRHALERAALEGGRTLTSEVNRRLANTLLAEGVSAHARGGIYAMADPDFRPRRELHEPAVHRSVMAIQASRAAEQQLIDLIRTLPEEKQVALLALLK